MKERRRVVEPDVNWKEITRAGIIYDAGNAEDFETGSWRSMKPVFHPGKMQAVHGLLLYVPRFIH
jgi:pyruvate ferredoxin oxidoreductase delta subunit